MVTSIHKVTNVSFESFRYKSEGRKVVLLYPWSNFRTMFLAYFLEKAKEGLLYYRITDHQAALTDWLTGLVEEFDSVLDGFGANLREALVEGKPAEMGAALSADLAAYDRESLFLYIDELDRATMDADFRQFIITLVDTLPSNVQFVVNSRMLTYQPWRDMVMSSDAIVLGTEQRRDDMLFRVEQTPRPQLEVYAFGKGHALVNGDAIVNWDGALPRNLFFFFIDRPLLTRDEIFATFWPDLAVKEATNVFHVTKRKVTERISLKVNDDENYELTQYNSGFYMPSEKLVRHYDVADFQEACDRAMVATNEKEEVMLLTRAVDIYKAPFLQTINMPWVEERREGLRQTYAQALIQLARIYQRRGDDQRALGFFARAVKESPEREDLHRHLMELYESLNMLDDAAIQYQKLYETLKERFNIEPAPATRELFERIEAKRR